MQQEVPQNAQPATQGSILVVEDEPELLRILSEVLSEAGFLIFKAADGEEALTVFDSQRPDAILTDINMPKKTGLEFIHELRSQGSETPCIILTGNTEKAMMLYALRLGVADFIEKPFSMDEVVQVLTRAVRLGVEMKNLSAELDEVCKSGNIPPEKWPTFKRMQLAKMILHRDSSALKKAV